MMLCNMKWYVDEDNNEILVGDAQEIIPIFKSISRYESAHAYITGRGYGTWQKCPRKRDGVIALVFEGYWCKIMTDADYIASCLIDGDWEPVNRKDLLPNWWDEAEFLLRDEDIEEGLFDDLF